MYLLHRVIEKFDRSISSAMNTGAESAATHVTMGTAIQHLYGVEILILNQVDVTTGGEAFNGVPETER